jgi:hypothetical protein
MLYEILFAVSQVMLLASLAFAGVWGRAAERYAALAIGLTWLGALFGQTLTGEQIPIGSIMLADWILALALLALAFRFRNTWLGFALILQGASMTLHAIYFQEPGKHPSFYLMGINGLSIAMLGLLVFATLLAMRRRRAVAAA